MKLIGNSMILGMMEVMAESFTLAEKAGIGADRTVDIVKELFPNPILLNYADKMVNDKFDGTKGFAIDGGIKDAQHIRRLTSEHNSPMPVIDVAHQHLITARALHGANKQSNVETFDTLDWSAIIAASRIAAGLDAFDTGKHEQLVRESQ
jgi:3-hydroxyisobutyrate dehydrogenase-like beta-hydroxyacid dehydrogenase